MDLITLLLDHFDWVVTGAVGIVLFYGVGLYFDSLSERDTKDDMSWIRSSGE